jgi:catechol 2,3-dioxygenase-like lactoylglutathione lyase family enzyme
MANYTGINHLAMVTHDMRITIRFWRDLLGMRLIAGLGRKGYRHYFFEISEHDMIAFFEWPHAEPIAEKDHGVPVNGPVAFDHVSIAVVCDDDLWELKDRLEALDSGSPKSSITVSFTQYTASIPTIFPSNFQRRWPRSTCAAAPR